MRIFYKLLVGLLFGLVFPTHAQLSNVFVDAGPYTPGSTIAATFKIDANSCISTGNTFTMLLSDPSGNFSPGTFLGKYDGFYSTFVNGVIPPGTPNGNGYKVKIVANNPNYSDESNSFSIQSGSVASVNIESDKVLQKTQDAYGFCIGLSGIASNILLGNKSTATSIVNAKFTNELTGTSTTFPIVNNITFTPDKAHYTMFVKAIMPDGSIGTRAYFIINNDVITAFTTSGNNVVCLPGGALTYTINTTGAEGIQYNFPGNTYQYKLGGSIRKYLYFLRFKRRQCLT